MLGIGMGINAIQQGLGLVDDGGSGLPEGAIAYADFKNGTFHYGGNALSDFLTEDTNWGNYSTDAVIADIGLYRATGQGLPVIADPLGTSLIASGFTIVLTFLMDVSTSWNVDLFDSPAFNEDVQFNFNSGGGTTGIFADGNESYTDPVAGMHIVALTYDAGHLAMCMDGEAVVTHDMATAPTLINRIGIGSPTILSRLVAYPAKTGGELAALCDFDPALTPENTVAPAITGTAQVGQTLTCSTGTWTNADSTHFQWLRPDGTLLDADATYVCQPEDVGGNLTCLVIAENAIGYAYQGAGSDTVVE